jgi:hypothetical protein
LIQVSGGRSSFSVVKFRGTAMGMVFCRGCGREIHESAPTCPLCGALQIGPTQIKAGRSSGKLLAWAFVWMCVFWVASLFLVGFFAGVINPENAGPAGERLGQDLAVPFLLGALLLSALLTYLGKLPGTKTVA